MRIIRETIMDKSSLTAEVLYQHTCTLILIDVVVLLLVSIMSISAYANILTGVTDLTFSSQSHYSCAVINHNTAKCWGANWAGQVGDGTTTSRLFPVDVSNLQGVEQLTTGGHHSCALLDTHKLECWGNNNKGQLGDGTLTNRLVPTEVVSLENVVSIAAGNSHTCAVINESSNNIVKCWGANTKGQLGNNSFSNRKIPVATIALGDNATAIAAGGEHTCALLENGNVKCWGANEHGQLGNGDTANSAFPITVLGLTNVKAIVTGEAHSCALLNDDTLSCWGNNDHGQLATNDIIDRLTPTLVTTLTHPIKILATGRNHICVTFLDSDDSLACWGDNEFGQLGIGTMTNSWLPAYVTLSEKVIKLSLGYNHSCALTDEDKVYCWGGNGGGQLGDGTTTSRTQPTIVQSATPDINVKDGINQLNQGDIIDLGSVNIGSDVSYVITIENTGIDALHLVTPLSITGSKFSVTKQPDNFVAGNTSTTFIVQFIPTSAATVNETITIYSNDEDESSYTFQIKGTGISLPEPLPASPANLIAIATSATSVHLTWQDESNDETGFAIYRNGTLINITGENSEEYQDNGLIDNTTYYYEIKAVNEIGNSLSIGTTVTTPIAPEEDDNTDEEEGNQPDPTDRTHYTGSNSYQLPRELSTFISMEGSGTGTVVSQPQGIECKSSDKKCRALFKTANTIEFIPVADEGSVFVGWGGHRDCGDGQVLLSGNRLCTAYFRKIANESTWNDATIPVYRFWSYYWKAHFYTNNESEKARVMEYPENWRDEAVAYYVFSQTNHPVNTTPVYRFWSYHWSSYFYTINEQEKEHLIQNFADDWRYEGIAFYAYPPGQQPTNAIPVYRMYSFALQEHFYTANEEEKLMLEQKCDAAKWRFEGISWYVPH